MKESGLKNKILKVLFDRKVLILVFMLCYIYAGSLVMAFSYGTVIVLYKTVFKRIFSIWSILILVHDLIKGRLNRSVVQLFLMGLMVISGISYLIHPPTDLFMLLLQVMFCVTFFSAECDEDREDYKKLLLFIAKNFVIAFFLMTFFSLLFLAGKWHIETPFGVLDTTASYYYGQSELVLKQGRYFGFYEHPVPAGVHCASTIVLQTWLFCNRDRSKILGSPAFGAVNAVVQMYMIYRANSRTAMLYLLVTAFFWCIYSAFTHLEKKKAALTLVGGLVLLSIILIVVKGDKLTLYYQLFKQDPIDLLNKLSSARIKIWSNCIAETSKTPFFGMGWANDSASYAVGAPFAHNLLVNIYVYTGLAGLVAVVGAFVFGLVAVVRNRSYIIEQHDEMLMFMLLGLLAASLTQQLLFCECSHVETPLFWLLAGFLVFRKGKNKNVGGMK